MRTNSKRYQNVYWRRLWTLFWLASFTLAGPVMAAENSPIKVGVLHALTSPMAADESPIKEIILMAIDELNRSGGIMGRQIKAVVEDPATDSKQLVAKAEKLLQHDNVAAVFGCWMSSDRKAILPVFESLNGLLFYPLQYEGEECSNNIIYMGATLNQQALPAADYLMTPEGGMRRRFYLIGTDDVYSRTTNMVLRRYFTLVKKLPATHILDMYTPVHHQAYDRIASMIKRFCLDGDAAIINTTSGASNTFFFKALAKQGVTADMCPVMSFIFAEAELQHMDIKPMVGHLAAWNYFMSLPYSRNFLWLSTYRLWCQTHHIPDAQCVTSDSMMHAYMQVKLWAKAVERAQSTDIDPVRRVLAGMSINSPGGKYRVDAYNHHTWKPVYIGKIRPDGQFDVVWKTKDWIRPKPWSNLLHRRRGCDWSDGGKGTYDVVSGSRVWVPQ